MAAIKKIHAYEIMDSRGYPTIEGCLTLDTGQTVVTSIPSGSSIGKYEAVELRDQDPTRFEGQGVTHAVKYVNELIGPKLVGVSPDKQQEIDRWLITADGTENKKKLGANTLLTVSQLVTKAAALSQNMSVFRYINLLYKTMFKQEIVIEKIPGPIFGIINGGKHANNNLEFQEFHVIPSSSYSFSKAYQTGVELFHELQKVLVYRNADTSVSEEGGFSPNFSTNLDAIEVLQETVIQRNLKPGQDIFFGLDIAASNFYKNERYQIKDKTHPMKRDEYIDFLLNLTNHYPMLLIEDPIYEDDREGWKKLYSAISEKVYVVGDDLVSTNKNLLAKVINDQICSSIIIKPNQIGTITETLEVIDLARKNNMNYIVSQRSGETNDSFIADLAVGIQADFVKFGAPSRGERIEKYNRLWQIEREEL